MVYSNVITFGMKMSKPTTMLKKAAIKTAPAEISLIRLIDSLCSNVISLQIFSIAVLNASVNKTKKSALETKSHSHPVSEKNTPSIITLKAEIKWY